MPICNCDVEVMLFSLFIDTNTLKCEISSWSEMGLDRAWEEDRVRHFEKGDTVGYKLEFECNDSCHLNCATERYSLAEVYRE